MEAIVQKKATMFRLNVDLIERLKELAKREHRSLNNFCGMCSFRCCL